MRKLATVREIKQIRPIAKADFLELAIVDGWQAIVKKGEFKAGDRVIYCEIDSFLPIREEYEFLRSSSYRKLADDSEGFRIRTMKMRGQLSQGLVLPLRDPALAIGADITEALGITKYDSTIGKTAINADIKGSFPDCIPKTDEERIQNLTGQLVDWEDRTWTVTEKLDGTSFTCYWYQGMFGVCSRNYELVDSPGSFYWQVAKQHNLEDKLQGSNLAIQGELVGEGIQKNKYNLERLRSRELFVFNVFDIDDQVYLPQLDAKSVAEGLGLKFVPIIERNFQLPKSVDEILALAEGKSQLNLTVEREGLVFVSDEGERVSFKAISNKLLLKEDG